jgi:hypothetical protein
MESGTDEGSDLINVSDIPVVFFEDSEGIRLEYNQAHKPFSFSITLLIYVRHKF